MSIILQKSKEEFEIIVKKSQSYADICRHLGLRREGGYYRTIQRRIKNENINISHFLSVKELLSNNKNFNWISKETFLERLKNNDKIVEWSLKKKLKEFNLIPYSCAKCNLNNIWNNEILTLQLDHIDGNHLNNKIVNLRWLCPNCHSQTNTFCGKHKKKKLKFCLECNVMIHKNSIKCRKCSSKENAFARRIIERPSIEKLLELKNNLSMTKIGKLYNVSDNTIRKWCKFYNIL